MTTAITTNTVARASLAFPVGANPQLEALGKHLVSFTAGEELLPRRTAEVGPFADYNDYKTRGLEKVKVPVRIYTIAGITTPLMVPETYASELDKVRRLRLVAAGKADETLTAEDARAQLIQHELRNRLLPEELAELLYALPDANYLKNAFLLPDRNWEDDWVRQDYSPTFVSTMAMTGEGELLMFKAEPNEFLRGDIMHEWVHRLADKQPEHYKVFGDAIELGWRDYVPRPYALRSYGEHWAVVGEELLKAEAEKFLACADAAKVRTTILFLALESCLESARHGTFHKELLARVNHVRREIMPHAIDELVALTRGDDSDKRDRATRLLEFINASK